MNRPAATIDEAWRAAGVPAISLIRTGPKSAIVDRQVELFGVEIPAGYETDGASVPRAFYNVLSRFGVALPAAILHDFRYDPAERYGVKQRWLSRAEADLEFYENLRKLGVNFARAQAALKAVRLFGWRAWNNGTKRGTLNP